MRLQDVEYLLERSGWHREGILFDCLPSTWRLHRETLFPDAEVVPVPFDGIMSFKPRFSGNLALYDVMDEISRVEEKSVRLDLADVARIDGAEVVLETWALKPDQILEVSINERVLLEFRVRGHEFRTSETRRKILRLYHPFDPRVLKEGANQITLRIRVVPGGDPMDSAALNSAFLRLRRRGD